MIIALLLAMLHLVLVISIQSWPQDGQVLFRSKIKEQPGHRPLWLSIILAVRLNHFGQSADGSVDRRKDQVVRRLEPSRLALLDLVLDVRSNACRNACVPFLFLSPYFLFLEYSVIILPHNKLDPRGR
jgi:hypothetical protein